MLDEFGFLIDIEQWTPAVTEAMAELCYAQDGDLKKARPEVRRERGFGSVRRGASNQIQRANFGSKSLFLGRSNP